MFSHPSNFLIPGTNHPIGAAHATEIPYKFDNIHPVGQESHADVQQPGSNIGMDTMIGTDKNREKVAHNMSEMWSSFARTGQPAAKGQPAWPAYTTKTRATMEIDAQCKIVNDPFDQERPADAEEHAEQTAFQLRHRWRKNDLVMWDNRCTQHLAVADYAPAHRLMHRITVQGDRPVRRIEQSGRAA